MISVMIRSPTAAADGWQDGEQPSPPKEEALEDMEPSLKVDIALFLDFAGSFGKDKLKIDINASLPNKTRRLGLDASSLKLAGILEKQCFRYLSSEDQSTVKTILEVVTGMLR